MARFDIGDQVRLKGSGKTGVVKTVFPSDYWNMKDDEYGVELDDGSGVITITERALEKRYVYPECECGLKYARSGGKHSFWCPLFSRNE